LIKKLDLKEQTTATCKCSVEQSVARVTTKHKSTKMMRNNALMITRAMTSITKIDETHC
jgi:hypothetical protein